MTPARRRLLVAVHVLLLAALPAPPAHAGMPMVLLSELAARRLESISFFLALLLAVAAGVRALWRLLRRDFPRLPELRFRHALALVLLWGLALNLVLTMISGARELMTPGAWRKEGATYRLAGPGSEPPRSAAVAPAAASGGERASPAPLPPAAAGAPDSRP